jgi:hypothetical protein
MASGQLSHVQKRYCPKSSRLIITFCYYSDLRKMREHYSNWDMTKPLDETTAENVGLGRECQV